MDLARCQRPARPIALCFGSPCHFRGFDLHWKRPHNGHLWTQIRAGGQSRNENIGQYATRLARYISNREEWRESYETQAEETIRQEGECTYCGRVGSLVPVSIMHTSEISVHKQFSACLKSLSWVLIDFTLEGNGFQRCVKISATCPGWGVERISFYSENFDQVLSAPPCEPGTRCPYEWSCNTNNEHLRWSGSSSFPLNLCICIV